MRTVPFVFLAVAAALASACGGGGADGPACPEDTEPFAQYELFMGRGGVTARSWTTRRGMPSSARPLRPGFLTA